MTKRRWTILVVPHDTETPRQYEVGEGGVRFLAGGLGAAGLLLLAAGVLLFSPWATPAGRAAARENVRLQQQVAQLDASLGQLGDSISVLATREAQFRQLAGITVFDSSRAVARPDSNTVGLGHADLGGRPGPFAALFGNRSGKRDVDALLRRASELSSAFAEVSDSMSAKIERLKNTPSIMPTKGWLVSEFSSMRMHPILHEMRPHEGIDVAAPMGAPIVAPAGGRVTRVTVEGGYGNVLEIDHGNGIVTRYAHCSRIVVHEGQRVDRGQTIAMVGNTGLAAGPHLHYEIMVGGKHVDPLAYVLPTG